MSRKGRWPSCSSPWWTRYSCEVKSDDHRTSPNSLPMRPDDRTVLHITQPAQEDRTEQSSCLIPATNSLVLPPALTGRCIKTWADFGGSQFTGDEDRDGSQNVGTHHSTTWCGR
jgi:hypothetical protein